MEDPTKEKKAPPLAVTGALLAWAVVATTLGFLRAGSLKSDLAATSNELARTRASLVAEQAKGAKLTKAVTAAQVAAQQAEKTRAAEVQAAKAAARDVPAPVRVAAVEPRTEKPAPEVAPPATSRTSTPAPAAERPPEKPAPAAQKPPAEAVPATPEQPSVDRFAELHGKFDEELRQIEERRVANFDTIRLVYVDSLDKIRQQLQAKGDLDGVLAVQSEQKRFEQSKSIEAGDLATGDDLRKLQAATRNGLAKSEAEQKQAKIKLIQLYVKHLDGFEKDMTKAGDIQKAIAARREKERATGLLNAEGAAPEE